MPFVDRQSIDAMKEIIATSKDPAAVAKAKKALKLETPTMDSAGVLWLEGSRVDGADPPTRQRSHQPAHKPKKQYKSTDRVLGIIHQSIA